MLRFPRQKCSLFGVNKLVVLLYNSDTHVDAQGEYLGIDCIETFVEMKLDKDPGLLFGQEVCSEGRHGRRGCCTQKQWRDKKLKVKISVPGKDCAHLPKWCSDVLVSIMSDQYKTKN